MIFQDRIYLFGYNIAGLEIGYNILVDDNFILSHKNCNFMA